MIQAMSPSTRTAVLTVAGTFAVLAAGAGLGAGLYASLAPATTTTVVEDVTATGETENASLGAGKPIGAVYQRTYEGVVDVKVSLGAAGSQFGFGGSAARRGRGLGLALRLER